MKIKRDYAMVQLPREIGCGRVVSSFCAKLRFARHPWHLLVLTLSASINHDQEKAIDYLRVENQAPRELLGNVLKKRGLGQAALGTEAPLRTASGPPQCMV